MQRLGAQAHDQFVQGDIGFQMWAENGPARDPPFDGDAISLDAP